MPRGQQNPAIMTWQDEGGRRLDQLLKSSRVKSVAIAERLGVDDSLVSRWRSGDRVPDADQLREMLVMAGRPTGMGDYLLGLIAYDPQAVERLRRETAALFEAVERMRAPLVHERAPSRKR